jgi:hypothetical protein
MIYDEMQQMIDAAEDWAGSVHLSMASELSGHIVTGDLAAGLRERVKALTQQGSIKIAFQFVRHGVFLSKGAGKGMGGARGSTWLDPHGLRKRTNPNSLGKQGSGSREAVDWFNNPIQQHLEALSRAVGDVYDEAVKATFI